MSEPKTLPKGFDFVAASKNKGREAIEAPRAPLLSDRLASEILDMIIENNLAPGDPLPTEGAIGEKFQVSRSVVREAVRSLASRNIIETRRGARPVVAAIPASAVSTSLSLYLRGGRVEVSYRKVHETRAAIEIEVARIAARRASHAAVGRLRDIYDAMDEVVARGEDMSKLDLEFHYEIARAADNEVFNMVLEPLVTSLLMVRQTTLEMPDVPARAQRAHKRILEAIASGDPEAAGKAMRRHLEEVLALWMKSTGTHDVPITPQAGVLSHAKKR